MPMQAQTSQILAHLKSGHTVTALDSVQRFRCLRLAARVKELREAGHRIETEMVRIGERKRIARYRLSR
jgi:hypothetical protein